MGGIFTFLAPKDNVVNVGFLGRMALLDIGTLVVINFFDSLFVGSYS
jgi:hypothetical protein